MLLIRAIFHRRRGDKLLISDRVLRFDSFVWDELRARFRALACPPNPWAERTDPDCTSPLREGLLHLWVSLWSLDRGLRFSISDWKLPGQDLVVLISSYSGSGLLPK